MLARFGFADPDAREQKHDLACQFLAMPDNHERLVKLLVEPVAAKLNAPITVHSVGKPALEHIVAKGGGGTGRFVVGFADVVLPFSLAWRGNEGVRYDVWDGDDVHRSSIGGAVIHSVAIVEVKITPTSLGDVLRQLKLYREHSRSFTSAFPMSSAVQEAGSHRECCPAPGLMWVLATAYDISEQSAASLRAEGVRHVRLGRQFNEWLTAREAKRADSPEF